MRISELSSTLANTPEATIRFQLPNGELAPAHAHVTEVARISKRFIDCGGTLREDSMCRLQTWVADDYDPRLTAGKLAKILQKAGELLGEEDLEIDVETGRTTVVRYTAAQDVGRAIHPAYVEGQLQGGAAQGIGWALNEEYVYGKSGLLENAGFLDYRMPVASDLPMIDTILIETKPNPRHPYGAKGVGEVPIVPPLAAVGNAVSRIVGKRMASLPLSPAKVLAEMGR